jgi:tripartite-type tricarboxylate transporter receptor subunit TctC
VFAPAGLPADVLAAYYAALQDVLKQPALIEKMAGLGSEPVTGMTPEQFGQFLEKDRQQWADIVKAANISLE